jgi:hypothetical protein
MPVYRTNGADLQKIRDFTQYAFLADNAKVDHGTHWTITLSHRSRDMLVRELGIEAVFVHAVHHVPPAPEPPPAG